MRLLLSTILVVPACTSAGPGAAGREDADGAVPVSCFLGDHGAAPQVRIVYRTAMGMAELAEEGGRIPLIQPPQGGKVMFIGVSARNLDGCPVTLTTALLERPGGPVISLESRPVYLEPRPDGWLWPKRPLHVSNYSNLPGCPRANLS